MSPLLGCSEDAKESWMDKCHRLNETFWTSPEILEEVLDEPEIKETF